MTTEYSTVSSCAPGRRLLRPAAIVLAGVVAAVWGARVGAAWAHHSAAESAVDTVRADHLAADSTDSTDSAADTVVTVRGRGDWDARPLRVAADMPLSELQHLPPIHQIAAVDALPPGPSLSPRQVAGLRVLIAAPQALEVVRNNAANRLVARGDDPELWRFFAAMHGNEDESAVWRDYSLQFWSLSIPFADDVATAAAELAMIAETAEENHAGTALLHLARLQGDGVPIETALIHAVIRARLSTDATPDALRHTCLALIGEGGYRALLPLARSALNDASGVEALRGALYSLGRLGDAGDRALIAPYLDHSHPAVVAAARAAEARLAAAIQADASPGDRS